MSSHTSTASPQSLFSDHEEEKRLFTSEQNQMFLQLLPLLYLANIVTGTFLLLIVAFSVGLGDWGAFWFSILIVSNVLQAATRHARFTNTDKHQDIKITRLFLLVSSLSSGIIWGTAWALLPPESTFIEIALIGLWLCGLQAGAAATKSVIKSVFLAYTIPANAIFLAFVAFTNIEFQFLTIAAYVMYLAFIIPISMRIGSELNKTIALKIQNQELLEKLEAERGALEKKETELSIQKSKAAVLESQRNSSQKKLAVEAEERVLLMDSVEEGIFGLNRFGEFTFINSSACDLLVFEESDVIGKSAVSLLSSALDRLDKEMKTNLLIGNCYLGNETLMRMDSVFCGSAGVRLSVRFSCRPVKKDHIVIGAVVSFSDMTKHKEMEAMLIQSQKMEAIGRLTGGVSHDFNNLLTIIMGNIQFLIRRLPDKPEDITLLKRIMAAAKSGAELNHRLLSFSREQTLKETNIDVNIVIGDMYDFLARVLGEDVSLKLELCGDDCIINIDKTQLENALLNLCVNARDAMPEGGQLKIETQLNPGDLFRYKDNLILPAEDIVLISVTDSGIGISPENLKQVFEPFFTTKKKDRGTGLGLSTAYGFIKQSGGSIVVESRQWEWTRFKIFLPKADFVEPEKESEPIMLENQSEMSGLVLVVEDDEHVRKVACDMLTESGFDVLSAEDGNKGLSLFRTNPDIEFVFSDIVMPGGMNGIQLAEDILAISPTIPIILVTGYTDRNTKQSIPKNKNIICISKPYDINEIPNLISKMITEAKSYE